MNKPLYFKICSVSIGIFLIIWLIAFGIFISQEKAKAKTTPTPADIPAKEVQQVVPKAEVSHYIVKSKEGKVAVWQVYSNGYSTPLDIPEISTDTLTPYDRGYFEEGIVIEDPSSLASLIEDFTS